MSEGRRVALVTGGAKRVGRAIAQTLADARFDIAFTYLTSEADASDLSAVLASRFAKALPIRVDLTQPDQAVEQIVAAITSHFGRLDVLINNASTFSAAHLDQTDSKLIQQVMALHLESPVLLCKALAPMLKRAHGHVVNMVDLLAERPWPAHLAYSASKAALANATLSLARELAPEVTVNGIAPGVIDWPKDMPQQDRDNYLKRVPLARAGTPEDAAKLVKFLVTEGTYITGQIIRLDGGRSIT